MKLSRVIPCLAACLASFWRGPGYCSEHHVRIDQRTVLDQCGAAGIAEAVHGPTERYTDDQREGRFLLPSVGVGVPTP